jgi:PilZ domain-containing protein
MSSPPDPPPTNGDAKDEGAERAPLADSVASVTPASDESETTTDVADRRLAPRRKKLMRIAVRNESTNELVNGWVIDRSLGGMCISVQNPIEAGAHLAVRRGTAPESMPWVELRVLNVREQESTWELGCEFLRTPAWEVLLQFE